MDTTKERLDRLEARIKQASHPIFREGCRYENYADIGKLLEDAINETPHTSRAVFRLMIADRFVKLNGKGIRRYIYAHHTFENLLRYCPPGTMMPRKLRTISYFASRRLAADGHLQAKVWMRFLQENAETMERHAPSLERFGSCYRSLKQIVDEETNQDG
ncbi:hypothetical protein [Desulfosarcina ovata]|uniref:hypothetical protein n=1 Tax=Desulfosarcina ovata TaxID=83564 RepID=UPI0012D34E86|nr:hypothetical protein [Desulfosarcina ovata]